MRVPCPVCAEPVAHEPGWAPWCEACDWGLPVEAPTLGRLERRWQSHLNAMSRREHERLLRSGLDQQSNDRRLVTVLAALVHLVTLMVVAVTGWLAVSPLPLPVRLVGVAFGVGLLVVLRPSLPCLPEGVPLRRTDAPELYAVLDEVAAASGAVPPALVVVDDEVNASWRRVGWKRTPVLALGLPLWASLQGQEKVALLGHELGHEVAHDVRRGVFVGSAVHALHQWRYLLTPVRTGPLGTPAGVLLGVAEVLVVVVLAPLLLVLLVLQITLSDLADRSGQRAEHLADRVGARVAGRDGALGAERALLSPELLDLALEVALQRDPGRDLFDVAQTYREGVPASQQRRDLRLGELTLQRCDATHPPTTRRLELVARAADGPALVVLGDREAALDASIATAQAWVRRRLVDRRR